MPCLTGPIQILNIGGGTVQFGDTAFISPKSASKTTSGSGSISTGPFHIYNNGLSLNQTYNTTGVDQPIVGNT
ncbi:spore germination protein [Jeotgalibacillus campisalis]|uniref:spore germination protein n=1 Tax=Jeotgalibacillus campisalis TaxID=220754 RepID=UPI0005975BD8|nr:spore germination protein [Jeotgalibacillus campisalis]